MDTPNTIDPPNMNILAIEDSPAMVRFLNIVLAKHGFGFQSAGDLAAGLRCIKSGHVDLVLLDLSLPDCNGLDTFKKIHAMAPAVPVVVLTGLNDERIALEAVKSGAQDYLVKGQPSEESLVRCLRYAIARKQIEQAMTSLNEELEKRVAERTAELARSNAELQQFCKIAAHDLQEPLRVIEGYSQLLARRYKGRLDKDADDFIHFIVDGTRRMGQLIQGVLSHSRAGIRRDRTDIVDSGVAVYEALRNLEAVIAESGACISVGDLPRVVADKAELVALFQNLIGNAVKYRSSEPPQINISATREGDDWKFAIRDNGIGIDPRFHVRIFDMFQRLHSRSEYDGTGIGLALCKKIVESHQGHIWVVSQPGEGSTFYVTLHAVPAKGEANEEYDRCTVGGGQSSGCQVH